MPDELLGTCDGQSGGAWSKAHPQTQACVNWKPLLPASKNINTKDSGTKPDNSLGQDKNPV